MNNGFHGDAAISFPVGTPDPADVTLIADTRAALEASIAAGWRCARV